MARAEPGDGGVELTLVVGAVVGQDPLDPDPETGELKARAETGLNDIAGLAYSPTSGKLYAVDFSWVDPTQGGLFRLDINEDDSTVTSVKICSLDKPSTLAFTPDGACYVTVFGTAEEGADPKKRPGKLVRIMAEL